MEPLFLFGIMLVVYCGAITCADLLRIEERIVARAVTELRVVERTGRMVLVLIRRHLATGWHEGGDVGYRVRPVPRGTA